MNSENLTKDLQNEISALIQSGELVEAKNLCISSLKRFPGEMNLFVSLSSISELMGDMNLAQKVLEKHNIFLDHLGFLNYLMRFYLRKKEYLKAKLILARANQTDWQSLAQEKTLKRINIIFNSETKQHQANIELTEAYIKKYPEDDFGYSFRIQCIEHLKFSNPEKLETIKKMLFKQINDNDISIHLTKNLLRTQGKLYSILTINNRQINEPKIAKKDQKKLLVERLQLLLALDQDTEEIDNIIEALFSDDLSINELNILLWESRQYEPLESQIIQYIKQNPKWLRYASVQEQMRIIMQCRSLRTEPLPKFVQQLPHPVDVVYTWCDMKDPNFVAKFQAQNGFDPTKSNDPNTGKCRYMNSQKIKLSLASLFKYFKDVNQVYIVTNEQQFDLDFLTIDQQEKIRFVDHTEIISREYIQGDVLNFDLIEAFLWNIPNLQEHFVYFNNDVVLGNYLQPHHLFDAIGNGIAITKPRKYNANLELNRLIDFNEQEIVTWDISIANAIKQFKTKNKLFLPFLNKYQARSMVKSECAKAFEKYQKNWEQGFFKEMLRGEKSVCSTLIYVWEAVLAKTQKIGNYHQYNRLSTVFNTGLNQENIRYIKQVKPLFYCLNHIGDQDSKTNLHNLTDSILGVQHPPHLFELIDYISQKTDIEHIIYINMKAGTVFDRLSDKTNVIEIDLAECLIADSSGYNSLYNPAPNLNLLSQKLAIDDAILEKSVVICVNVIERLPNPNPLIDTLAKWSNLCKYILVTAPDRERVNVLTDSAISTDKAYLMKWTLEEFCNLLSNRNLPVGLFGHTLSNSFDDSKATSLVISGQEAVCIKQPLVPVTAIINCYNEADIIKDVVLYLIEQDVNIVIADNWSTDGSYEIVQQLAEQYPRLTVTRFPDVPTNHFSLNEQLINTVSVSEQLGYGWYIHYDADEIKESPWQGVNLREAISFVDSLGYNAIDFTILNFRYLKDQNQDSTELFTQRLSYCKFGEHISDFLQIKGWKYSGQTVNLNNSGGHDARFEDQQVYPFKFLNRHYPLRSREQAHQKLFQDRFPRFRVERQTMSRHGHYDYITKKQLEGWDKEYLFKWDSYGFGTEYLVERISGVGLSVSKPREETSATYEAAIKTEPNNSRLYFMLAKTHKDEGNIEKAIAASQKAFELDSQSVDIVEQLSQLLMQTQQVAEALSLVESMVESQADNPRIYSILGNLQHQLQNHEQAISAYQKATEINSEDGNTYFALGQILREQKHLEEAIIAYENSLKIQPQHFHSYVGLGDCYRQQQNLEQATSFFQKSLELNPNNFSIWLVLGQVQHEQEDTEQAILSYKKAIELDDKDGGVHFALGQILRGQKRIEEAIVAYQSSIDIQPQHFHSYVGLGDCYHQLQDLEQAISFFQKSLELNPKNTGIWIILGDILQKQGDTKQAILSYEQAIGLETNNINAYVTLGNFYRQEQYWSKAISSYQKAIELGCQDGKVHFTLGQILRARKRIEEAIVAYQSSIDIQPQHFHSYVGLGDCYHQLQDLEQAISFFQKSLELNPNNANIWFVLGEILRKQGETEKAIASYQKALDTNHPNLFAVYKTMGDTLQEIDEINQAISAFEKAMEIQPDHPIVKQSLDQLVATKSNFLA